MSLDQALAQPAAPAEPGLQTGHATSVPLVIIAKEVQEAMQGQDAKLGPQGVARVGRLTARHPGGNHDVAQIPRLP